MAKPEAGSLYLFHFIIYSIAFFFHIPISATANLMTSQILHSSQLADYIKLFLCCFHLIYLRDQVQDRPGIQITFLMQYIYSTF